MAQYSKLGAYELYFDFKNAIHNKIGCFEVIEGHNRGQKSPKITFLLLLGNPLLFFKNAPKNSFYGPKSIIWCVYRYPFVQGCIGACTGPPKTLNW